MIISSIFLLPLRLLVGVCFMLFFEFVTLIIAIGGKGAMNVFCSNLIVYSGVWRVERNTKTYV